MFFLSLVYSSGAMKVKREIYLKDLRSLREKNLIKVVTGMRRVGKSTLLADFRAELLASGVPESRIQSVNFEERRNLRLIDWTVLHDEIEARLDPDGMNYIFLDEIQMVDNFERMLNSLFVKPNTDLYVTGSNAFLLSGELATLLTGRYISIHVLPYSFTEYSQAYSQIPQYSSDAFFRQFLSASTMPEAVTLATSTPEHVNRYLRGVFDTVVRKDILTRAGIRDAANFEAVAKFAFDTAGSFVSPRSIANTFNAGRRKGETSISHNTVENYLSHLAGAFALYKADRYDIQGKSLLKTQQKYFAVDLGLKDALLGSGSNMASLGRKLENLVYLELLRRNPGAIWVGKHEETEVDFIVEGYAGERSYYQVAYSAADDATLERELRPLRKIRDNHPKFILTADPDKATYEGIRKINAIDWLAP